MFEGTLVESQGLGVSGTRRWTALGSVVLQCAVAGLLVAIPLLHPEALPMLMDLPKLVVPVPPKPPKPVALEQQAASASTSYSVPVESAATRQPIFTRGAPTSTLDSEAPVGPLTISMSGGSPSGLLVGMGSPGPDVVAVPAKKPSLVRLSSGVTEGMLLKPIQPVYPRIAVAAGVQGAVVLEAMISKTGAIESLRVVSGPPMLRQAALDAVQAARYKPYKLNGDLTEVQTTITVNFRLGS